MIGGPFFMGSIGKKKPANRTIDGPFRNMQLSRLLRRKGVNLSVGAGVAVSAATT